MKNFSGTKYLLSIVLVFGLTSSFLYKAEVGFSEEKKASYDSSTIVSQSMTETDEPIQQTKEDTYMDNTQSTSTSFSGKENTVQSAEELLPRTDTSSTEKQKGQEDTPETKRASSQEVAKVSTYNAFKAALLDSNVQTISLEKDIKLVESFNFFGGKKICGNGHTIDVNFQSIGVAQNNAVCTIEEVHLINQPIYPFFWSELPGVTVNYRNVTSSGYQFIYLAAGTANLEETIEATAQLEEVFQGKKLTIKENADVHFKDTTSAIAINTGDGLTVEDKANLSVDAKGLGLFMYNPTGKIDLHGKVIIDSATDSAIRGGAANGTLVVQPNAELEAHSKITDEEAILLYNGSVIIKSNGTLITTSEGLQATLQTGKQLEIEEGANFLVANRKGSALGAWELQTAVALSSSQGVSTWKVGQIEAEEPDAAYQGPLSASFKLDTFTTAQYTMELTTNDPTFKEQFDSGKVGKITGGCFAKNTEMTPTTIEPLTTESGQVSGNAEPRATIDIKVDDKVIANGTVDPNGKYQLPIPNQKEGTIVVAVAKRKNLSAEASTVVQYAGPRIELPEKLTFDVQEIPASDRLVKLANAQEINVSDNSQKQKIKWTLLVREEQPLKNKTSGELANRLSISAQDHLIQITVANQPVLEGTGSAQLKLTDCMGLTLHPTDKTGPYKGTLTWTFMNGPQ